MPALNFHARFAEAVTSGAKSQTIRAHRKHPIKVGDVLYFYTGMRTKACRKLRAVVCRRVEPITITGCSIWIEGAPLRDADADMLAKRDGFRDRGEMFAWFDKAHGLPFEGVLIEWDP